jgi:hypothetical protein
MFDTHARDPERVRMARPVAKGSEVRCRRSDA